MPCLQKIHPPPKASPHTVKRSLSLNSHCFGYKQASLGMGRFAFTQRAKVGSSQEESWPTPVPGAISITLLRERGPVLDAADGHQQLRRPQGPLLPTQLFVQSHSIELSQGMQLIRYNSPNPSHFAVSNGYSLVSLVFTWLFNKLVTGLLSLIAIGENNKNFSYPFQTPLKKSMTTA